MYNQNSCSQMSAKDYLTQAYRLDMRIGSKLQQVESLNLLATKCTSTITDMPKNPSPSCSPMEDAICKILDLENEISADIERLVDLKREISEAVDKVKDVDCRLLLEKRYLSGLPWEQIAVDFSFCMDNVFKLHRKALAKFEIP